jgi:hypothetical protein
MPSTTPERAARWPGGDDQAIAFLHDSGFTLERNWTFTAPKGRSLDTEGYPWVSEKENDALIYLIEEWDFGGLNKG